MPDERVENHLAFLVLAGSTGLQVLEQRDIAFELVRVILHGLRIDSHTLSFDGVGVKFEEDVGLRIGLLLGVPVSGSDDPHAFEMLVGVQSFRLFYLHFSDDFQYLVAGDSVELSQSRWLYPEIILQPPLIILVPFRRGAIDQCLQRWSDDIKVRRDELNGFIF
ncbi:hypothetical protein D3C84_873890 [compost metagenome]